MPKPKSTSLNEPPKKRTPKEKQIKKHPPVKTVGKDGDVFEVDYLDTLQFKTPTQYQHIKERHDEVKKSFLRTVLECEGDIMAALRKSGIKAKYHHEWLRTDPVYKEAYEYTQGLVVSWVERFVLTKISTTEDEKVAADLAKFVLANHQESPYNSRKFKVTTADKDGKEESEVKQVAIVGMIIQ